MTIALARPSVKHARSQMCARNISEEEMDTDKPTVNLYA